MTTIRNAQLQNLCVGLLYSVFWTKSIRPRPIAQYLRWLHRTVGGAVKDKAVKDKTAIASRHCYGNRQQPGLQGGAFDGGQPDAIGSMLPLV